MTGPNSIDVSWEEAKELPKDLRNQLNFRSDLEISIKEAMDAHGGIISLNRLLVEIWKQTGEVYERRAVSAKLFRMSSQKHVYRVLGKKGVYSTKPISKIEMAEIMNGGLSAK